MRIESQRNFGTRECPSCGTHIEANHNRCPICNYLIPQPTPLQRGMRRGGALLMLILLLVLLLAGLLR